MTPQNVSMANSPNERSPLLQAHEHDDEDRKLIDFSANDPDYPRAWSGSRKLRNIGVIALMSILSPLASSVFAPGIPEIASALHTEASAVIACQTGYVVMLGVGPLVLAPLSETFGRKVLYLGCFVVFTVLQVPAALSWDVGMLIAVRAVTGFFGSVGIANGGGTISDMYAPSERAGIFGWYLLGPLLGPTIGPLLGGLIMEHLAWPWIFWVMGIICSVNVTLGFLFLEETYVPVLLEARKKEREKLDGGSYYYNGEDDRPLGTKLYHSMRRPLRILFTQPIVWIMASYQALIFATTYSLYTQMPAIYGDGYGFSTQQVGLLYLGPGLGFLFSVWFLVPRIGTVYNSLTKQHNGQGKPEYRLPLANIGSLLIPVSLFWFGRTVQFHVHWFVTILSTLFYGIGQVVIFNSTQKYAASAIAAGALFRSAIGGVVPLFTPGLFEKLGVGWGMSVFACVSVALAPSPLLFYYFGEKLRNKFFIVL